MAEKRGSIALELRAGDVTSAGPHAWLHCGRSRAHLDTLRFRTYDLYHSEYHLSGLRLDALAVARLAGGAGACFLPRNLVMAFVAIGRLLRGARWPLLRTSPLTATSSTRQLPWAAIAPVTTIAPGTSPREHSSSRSVEWSAIPSTSATAGGLWDGSWI